MMKGRHSSNGCILFMIALLSCGHEWGILDSTLAFWHRFQLRFFFRSFSLSIVVYNKNDEEIFQVLYKPNMWEIQISATIGTEQKNSIIMHEKMMRYTCLLYVFSSDSIPKAFQILWIGWTSRICLFVCGFVHWHLMLRRHRKYTFFTFFTFWKIEIRSQMLNGNSLFDNYTHI